MARRSSAGRSVEFCRGWRKLRLEVQLFFVYLEQLPVELAHGYTDPALGALAELESIVVPADEQMSDIQLSCRVLSPDQAEAMGHEWSIGARRVAAVACLEGFGECDLELIRSWAQAQDRYWTEEELKQVACEIAGTNVQKTAGDFVLASDISLAGCLHPYFVEGYVNGIRCFAERINSGHVEDARAEFVSSGWPPFLTLRLAETIDWLAQLVGFDEGVPTGGLGRAVAAFSHLIGFDSDTAAGTDLMWAMLGLEALYTSGHEGLSDQLREKVAVLLGDPHANMKRFRSLYDYRSRFVHGSLDIPLSYSPFDAVDSFSDSEGKTYHAELTAVALLLSSLQAMVAQGRSRLEFKWGLEDDSHRTGQALQPDASRSAH